MESNLSPLIETLDDNIDDLEEVFAPLLKTALGDTVQKLPLLDKAQFYVLITYSIESALFCECCHVKSVSA
jgi:exosome complex protein LRP1